MNWLQVLIFLSYIFCFFILIKRQAILVTFFFLIYTLQFWPLFFAGDEVVFWPNDNYIFEKDSSLSYYMWSILGTSTLAAIFSIPLIRKPIKEKSISFKNKVPDFISYMLIVLLLILVYIKLSSSGNFFNGMELLITSLIVITYFMAFSKRNKFQIVLVVFSFVVFVVSQFYSADRNFIAVIISLLIYYLSFSPVNWARMILVFISSLVILGAGVYISMARNGLALSGDSVQLVILYLYYNSWTAVIRPVIDMLVDESYQISFIYGKTYFDLLLSIFPSPFYAMFGAIKPFEVDNPAMWYHFEGGGGMHVIGVALKNFGLLGVFFQTYGAIYLLNKLVIMTRANKSIYYSSFFVCITLVLMKSVWYSLLDLTNVIFLFFMILFFVEFCKIILPLRPKSGC